jgi:hypothetical protein
MSGYASTLTLPTTLAEGAMKQVSLMAGAMLGRPITSRCLLTVAKTKTRRGCHGRGIHGLCAKRVHLQLLRAIVRACSQGWALPATLRSK